MEDNRLIVTPPKHMIHPFCCVSGLHKRASVVLDVCERNERTLKLFRKTGSFLPRPPVYLWPRLSCFTSFVCVDVVGVVVCTSNWSPAIFSPLSRSTTILTNVNVYVACANTFLSWVFAFAFLLAFLERIDLHPVVIISTCSIPC